MEIKVYFSGGVASVKAAAGASGVLTDGMQGVIVQGFFSEDWDGLTKMMYAKSGSDDPVPLATRIDNTAILPASLLVGSQPLFIGCDGWKEGEKRIPTTWARCGIVRKSINNDITYIEPDPDIIMQIMRICQESERIAQSVREDADNGRFDGSPGITPALQIGSVESVPPEKPAEVTISGTPEKPVLHFKLQRGPAGEGATVDATLTIPGAAADAAAVGQFRDAAQTFADAVNMALETMANAESRLAESINDLTTFVYDVHTEEKTREEHPTWENDLIRVNGAIYRSASYIHSTPIPVSGGNVIRLKKSDRGNVASSTVAAVLKNGAFVSALGSEGSPFPYTVPDGADAIVFTLSGAYRTEGVYAIIDYTDTTKEAKSYTKTETDELLHNAGKVKTVNGIEPDENGNIDATKITASAGVKNAVNYGLLPINSAADNFTAFQRLLDAGGKIMVDAPGEYAISGMLKIGSNTTLICGDGVVFRQESTTGFIVNDGANGETPNKNIAIVGLHIKCNGKSGDSSSYRTGLRGKIAFYNCKNITLDGIYVDDIPSSTYFVHIAKFENVTIKNSHIEGNKDGLHFSGGSGLLIKNCDFATGDDPIAFNVQDYPSSIPFYGDIENVLVEDCIDNPHGTNLGRFALIYGGAWLDWANGNTYRNGDTVVSTNGKVYRCIVSPSTNDDGSIRYVTSTVAPHNDRGTGTTSDGLRWQWVQDNPVYNVRCKNIMFRNIKINRKRSQVFKVHNDESQYCRSIYPGAIMIPHESITLDNITVVENSLSDYFCMVDEPVNNLCISNSDIMCNHVFFVKGTYDIADDNRDMDIVVFGTKIQSRPSESVSVFMRLQNNIDLNIWAFNNDQETKLSKYVEGGTVNFVSSDLVIN